MKPMVPVHKSAIFLFHPWQIGWFFWVPGDLLIFGPWNLIDMRPVKLRVGQFSSGWVVEKPVLAYQLHTLYMRESFKNQLL